MALPTVVFAHRARRDASSPTSVFLRRVCPSYRFLYPSSFCDQFPHRSAALVCPRFAIFLQNAARIGSRTRSFDSSHVCLTVHLFQQTIHQKHTVKTGLPPQTVFHAWVTVLHSQKWTKHCFIRCRHLLPDHC